MLKGGVIHSGETLLIFELNSKRNTHLLPVLLQKPLPPKFPDTHRPVYIRRMTKSILEVYYIRIDDGGFKSMINKP